MKALHRIACNISLIPRVTRVPRPPARTLLRVPCRTLSATASTQLRKIKGIPCPQCQKPLPTSLPACPSCSYIEPVPPGTTYYQALGLTHPDYNPYTVNLRTIVPVFRQTQKVCHPDRWAQQSPVRLYRQLPIMNGSTFSNGGCLSLSAGKATTSSGSIFLIEQGI